MAESVVQFLLESLAIQLRDEFRTLRTVRSQVQLISDELDRIKSFLRFADAMEDRDSRLHIWLKQVRDLAHDIEDCLAEFDLRLARTRFDRSVRRKLVRFVQTLIARRRIAVSARDLAARARAVSEGRIWVDQAGLDRKLSGSSGPARASRGDAMLLEEADLVGIGENKASLIGWLLGNENGRHVVCVVGMGGLGKTTLVKQVYEDFKVKKRFKVHAWVTVTRSFKTKDFLRDVVRQIFRVIRKPVPGYVNDMNSDALKEKIKDLLRQSRYLIVLDDVWSFKAWSSINLALPNSEKFGSRIVITTRNAEIAVSACGEARDWVFELGPLGKDESWELFCRKAFRRDGSETCPAHLEEKCRTVLARCGGLPLAIVAVGAVLGAKDERAIGEELVALCCNIGTEIEENYGLESMKSVLSLSFNDLPYYLKSCFLCLSLFPALQSVETVRLIRLWIAEGFVAEKDGRTLEEVAEGYFKELLDRGLVQAVETTSDGRIKSCKTHDILREIAILKAKEQDFAEIARDQGATWTEKARRLSITSTTLNLDEKPVPKLRTLLVFPDEDSTTEFSLPTLFPRGFRLLKVLDLRGLPLHSFPTQLAKLHHIKYLSLRNTNVKQIPPFIKNLENLETLDLKQTLVTELPAEISHLTKLRHLLAYRYEIESYAHFDSKHGVKSPPGIGALTRLQKLCFVESEHVVSELQNLQTLTRLGLVKFRENHAFPFSSSVEKLTKLRSLSITAESKDNPINLTQITNPPETLQRMYLAGKLNQMPHWLTSLRNLVILFLKWTRLKEDPLVHLGDLPNLVHLEFLQVFDGESLHFRSGGFQKLRLLGLDKMERLRAVTIDRGVMSGLEKMVIQRCKAMTNVPDGIEHLEKLKAVELFDMADELVMKLRPEGGEDHWKVAKVAAVYSSYWIDGGWDVYSVERFSEERERESSSQHGVVRRHQRSTLWKV